VKISFKKEKKSEAHFICNFFLYFTRVLIHSSTFLQSDGFNSSAIIILDFFIHKKKIFGAELFVLFKEKTISSRTTPYIFFLFQKFLELFFFIVYYNQNYFIIFYIKVHSHIYINFLKK